MLFHTGFCNVAQRKAGGCFQYLPCPRIDYFPTTVCPEVFYSTYTVYTTAIFQLLHFFPHFFDLLNNIVSFLYFYRYI